MAAAKAKKPAIEMVFGVGGKPDEAEDVDSSHEEATETLKDALNAAGIEADDTLMSALHQYVEACIKKPPDMAVAEEEEY